MPIEYFDAHAQRLNAQAQSTAGKTRSLSDEAWVHAIHRRSCGVDLWDPPFIARRRANAEAYRLVHPSASTADPHPSMLMQRRPDNGNAGVIAELMDELDALLAA